MTWICEHCGCLHIAASVDTCPHCHIPREGDMPKVTKDGGGTSAYEGLPAEEQDEVREPAEEPAKPTRKAQPAKSQKA